MIPLAALALLQSTRYKVTLEGGATGTARLTQTKRTGGGKVVRLAATLRRGGSTIELHVESTYDATGSPLRKLQSFGLPGRAATHEVIVSFDADGAHAVVRERGTPKVTDVPLAKGLSRANAAEMWFVATKPKVGDVAKAYTFDADALEWVPTETTYVGEAKEGHRLKIVRRDRTSEAVVDDAGLPVRVDDGAMKLVRDL